MTKENYYYSNWLSWLAEYCLKNDINFNINIYEKDILREMFANKLTVAEAYRELLSELPKRDKYESEL